MAIQNPTPVTPLATEPPQRGVRSTFSDLMDSFVTWFTMTAIPQMAALVLNVYNNAIEAYNSAVAAKASEDNAAASAAASISASNAVVFTPGTNYPQYRVVWSPIDLLTYRRKTAGASSTDPSLDPANWQVVSGLNLAQLHAAALYF
jgi:hypothetical protein